MDSPRFRSPQFVWEAHVSLVVECHVRFCDFGLHVVKHVTAKCGVRGGGRCPANHFPTLARDQQALPLRCFLGLSRCRWQYFNIFCVWPCRNYRCPNRNVAPHRAEFRVTLFGKYVRTGLLSLKLGSFHGLGSSTQCTSSCEALRLIEGGQTVPSHRCPYQRPTALP